MTGGCPSAPAVTFGSTAQVGAEIDAPAYSPLGIRLAGLRIERIDVLANAREDPLVRSTAPVSDAAVVSPGGSAGVELPDLLPRRRVDRKDFLRGRISVEHAVDDDRVRFQCARTVADVIGPGDLELVDVARVDLFQRRIPHSTRAPAATGHSTFGRRALRIDHRYHHDEISDENSPQPPQSHFALLVRRRRRLRGTARVDPQTQNVAIGFSTEPVAPGTATGDAVTRNSHRFRLAASRSTASRSRLSKMGIAHRDERQGVNRLGDSLDARRMDVLGAVAAENRHVMFFEPFGAGDVEARELTGVVGTFRISKRPSSRSNQDRIAGLNLEARLLDPCVQIFRINPRARLEILDTLQSRNVHQHAAGDDAVLPGEDRPLVAGLSR